MVNSVASLNFNSHPHEEDDYPKKFYQCTLNISTHILTRRMTNSIFMILVSVKHFNSHPHEEDDILGWINCSLIQHFNSHPHEEDD